MIVKELKLFLEKIPDERDCEEIFILDDISDLANPYRTDFVIEVSNNSLSNIAGLCFVKE